MNYLSIEKITKSFHDKIICNDISLQINKGEKIALVGANGVGKSTLIKMLMKEEYQDHGIFKFNKSIKVGFLKQEATVQSHAMVIDYILSGTDEISKTVREYYHYIESTNNDEVDIALLNSMTELNAWGFEANAKQILGKLGINTITQPTKELSEGQRKRVALAKILLEKPDMFILDEPTNHLDLDTIEWLEEYFSKSKSSLLLVTHDRHFLQTVTNTIIELENGNLYKYTGNYQEFLQKRLERHTVERDQAKKATNLLKKETEWLNRQPKARTTKAKYRVEAIDEIKKVANQVVSKKKISIDFASRRLGGKILEVENLTKQFGNKKIIDSFSYTYKHGDRIGLVGKNGIGKSTFLNLLTQEIPNDTAAVIKGETVVFGYYRQSGITFKNDQRVIDVVKDVAEVIKLKDNRIVTASQLLTLFNFFVQKQHNYVKDLSGGEKRKLQLIQVLMSNPNFLILDEPTNDLDLDTLNTLEEYLLNFTGCIMIVSHDRYFMNRLVNHVFAFQGNGVIKDYPGNYIDYRQNTKNKETTSNTAIKASTLPRKEKNQPKKQSFSEKKTIENLEKKLEKLEKEKIIIINKLNSEERDFEKLAEWGKDLKKINETISINENQWVELN